MIRYEMYGYQYQCDMLGYDEVSNSHILEKHDWSMARGEQGGFLCIGRVMGAEFSRGNNTGRSGATDQRM